MCRSFDILTRHLDGRRLQTAVGLATTSRWRQLHDGFYGLIS